MLSAFAGGRLFGERSGEKKPWLLALHGWGRTHADWKGVVGGLDAIAIDLPGFGASPAPTGPFGLEDFAKALMPVLDEFSRPAVVVGHSHGGSVAVHLAHTAGPERVGGLVLAGSPLVRPAAGESARPSPGFRVARWLHRRGILPEVRMEALRRTRGSADYRAATGAMRETLVRVVNEDVAHLLPLLDVPVRLVWGELDADVPPSVAATAAGLVDDSHLVLLPGVGHDVPALAPDPLRAEVLALAALLALAE